MGYQDFNIAVRILLCLLDNDPDVRSAAESFVFQYEELDRYDSPRSPIIVEAVSTHLPTVVEAAQFQDADAVAATVILLGLVPRHFIEQHAQRLAALSMHNDQAVRDVCATLLQTIV